MIVYPLRRLGSGVTHYADELQLSTYDDTHFGAAATFVEAPVTTLCGTVLRASRAGGIVWMRGSQNVCRYCEHLSNVEGVGVRGSSGVPTP